jgi:hypothetical protein
LALDIPIDIDHIRSNPKVMFSLIQDFYNQLELLNDENECLSQRIFQLEKDLAKFYISPHIPISKLLYPNMKPSVSGLPKMFKQKQTVVCLVNLGLHRVKRNLMRCFTAM